MLKVKNKQRSVARWFLFAGIVFGVGAAFTF